MDKVAKVATVAGVAAAGYLTYDYVSKRGVAGAGVPLVVAATDSVRNLLPASIGGASRRLVATPYPVLQVQPRMVIEGTRSNRALYGVMELAREICGEGSQHIVAALASCESMNGSLNVSCYNCNLFGMHISGDQVNSGRPYIISNGERFIDFLTGQPSQVEGFKACLRSFMDWLNRHCPTAIAPMRASQWFAFEEAWADRWGATSYKSDIRDGRAWRSTLQNRYTRLVDNHLAG